MKKILFTIISLTIFFACAITFEDPVSQIAYSCVICFLSMPLIIETGWIGDSRAGKVIGCILIFSISLAALRKLMQFSKILKVTKVTVGLGIFFLLLMSFWETTLQIIKAANWY